ncbi:MAG: hypothetical protein SGARI_008345, partial [Bacillariaceae sp.]
MLLLPTQDGKYEEYIAWSRDGKSVLIPNRNAFIKHVSSKNGPKKWGDFQSLMNRQGFRSANQNGAKAEFFHPLLVRGKPQLAAHILSMRGVPKDEKQKMLKQMETKKYQEKLLLNPPPPKPKPSVPKAAKAQKPVSNIEWHSSDDEESANEASDDDEEEMSDDDAADEASSDSDVEEAGAMEAIA